MTACLAVAMLGIGGCGGPPSTELSISVTGLPPAQSASLVITGRGVDLRVDRRSPIRESKLPPGHYRVRVLPVVIRQSPAGMFVAKPVSPVLDVVVFAKQTTDVPVAYAPINSEVAPMPEIRRVFWKDGHPSAVTLRAGTASAIAKGTILVSAPTALLPDGLVAAVTGGTGAEVFLETESLADVVPYLSSAMLELTATPHAPTESRCTLGSESDYGLTSRISYRVSVGRDIELRAFLDAWRRELRLALALRSTEWISAVAGASMHSRCVEELGPYVGSIGIGPVSIPVYAAVRVTTSSYAHGRFAGTFTMTGTVRASVAAHGTRVSRPNLQLGSALSSTSLSLAGRVALSAEIELTAGIGLPDAGISLRGDFRTQLGVAPERGCQLTLQPSSLDARADVFGVPLRSIPLFTLHPRTLWRGCSSPGQSGKSLGDQLAAGTGFACWLDGRGAAQCSGADSSRESEPPPVSFTQISAGMDVACGLLVTGNAQCWGDRPVASSTPNTQFKQITAGGSFACGLKPNGQAQCWRGHASDASPTGVTFMQISAGSDFACGLEPNGRPECWGDTAREQLRQQSATFTQIAAGSDFACGLEPTGRAACWGRGSDSIAWASSDQS